MQTRKGDTWNESELFRDTWTLRRIRRITSAGSYNQTPTYHTGTAWTSQGEFLIFASGRQGKSAVFCCETATGDITQLTDWVDGMQVNSRRGISGGRMAVAPTKHWVAYPREGTLQAVHLETLEERTLIADIGPWDIGSASIDPDEAYVMVPADFIPEPLRTPKPFTTEAAEHFTAPGGARRRLLRVPLEGGEVEVVHEDKDCRGPHLQINPQDPDLVLVDRDYPPNFWFGSDGETTRAWAFRLSTGAYTELPSRDGGPFQVHSVWTWDGEAVLYHTTGQDRTYHIGVVAKGGHTLWEHTSEAWTAYGHVSAMAGRPAIILDGNVSNDLLVWMDYDRELPQIEVIARHGTNWGGHEGQYPHPHPQSDPTGRYISFNAAERGRSDVFIVEVG